MNHCFSRHYEDAIRMMKQNVLNRIYTKIQPLEMIAWITKEPVPFSNKQSGEKKHLSKGDRWGELWDCAWFNFTGQVPTSFLSSELVLLIDINGEACIYDKLGCPVCGLTNVSSTFDTGLGKPGKRVVHLSPGTKTIDLWADCGCNDLFGSYSDSATIIDADIAYMDKNMHQLFYDIVILEDLLHVLPKESARYQRIRASLYKSFTLLKGYTSDEVEAARNLLQRELSKTSGTPSLEISAIGHSHIDLAWLWPIRETKRKVLRTFSTALTNLELYPDYIYGSSQPQLYFWVKENAPQLYKKIKKRIEEGRWEVQGGMWVEADTNITGGEALVRQILYGKKFFKEEFGVDVETLWLPDVFGYSASLPQILDKSGIKYFMTIKLSWNSVNQFPHHTFMWQGLDGTQILAHMPPEGTYNSSGMPRAAYKTETNYLDLDVAHHALLLFGIGDGGGGPGEEHLESMQRLQNLNGLSPVVQEPSLKFFKKLEQAKEDYATWVGELYLEVHQGTYTSQAQTKKLNRLLEHKLTELELASIMAHLYAHYDYPQDTIETIWKEVLLYQFHDILPGSSIKRVYDESSIRYGKLLSQTTTLMHQAFSHLQTSDSTKPSCLFNSLSWEISSYNKVDGTWYQTTVPALSIEPISTTPYQVHSLSYGDNFMENSYIKVRFNSDGTIGSIYDKEADQEVLTGLGNNLIIYDEIGGNNWDFSPIMREQNGHMPSLISFDYLVDGPYIIRNHYLIYNDTKIKQSIILSDYSKCLVFKTHVDWKEVKKQLRTSFQVNVHTDHVNCNIQFGNLKRTNHQNTSWDNAKYEICAHKYVDLSQADYGVALLNDCKYGHYVKSNIIDLHLIRNSGYPDKEMDLGIHEFTYSLYPHIGDFTQSKVVKEAYELNKPPLLIPPCKPVQSLFTLDKENIIIESIKMAEDGSGYIVRLYECMGGVAHCQIKAGFPYVSAMLCNLMESEIELVDLSLPITFKPFEILTLKIKTI